MGNLFENGQKYPHGPALGNCAIYPWQFVLQYYFAVQTFLYKAPIKNHSYYTDVIVLVENSIFPKGKSRCMLLQSTHVSKNLSRETWFGDNHL